MTLSNITPGGRWWCIADDVRYITVFNGWH